MRIKKRKDTRSESKEEQRETGEQKGRTFRKREHLQHRHLRFEEAFELNNLDYFFIIGCCNSLWVDIYIFKSSTRGIIQQTLDSSRHTHNKIDYLEEI